MKKGILLLLGLVSITAVNATTIKTPSSKIGVNYRYNDAVTFVERGVQFHVFLNGDFDFNIHARNNRYYDYNGIRVNNGLRIERDYRGRIRRVGNVFINYDARGNVKRIGNVFMQYRFGNLSRVGNLKIVYDRWGYPNFNGYVKPGRHYDDYYYNDGLDVNIDINIGGIFEYDDAYFYKRDFRNNYRQFKEDNNYFYYKTIPNAKIGKKAKIIKRKKPAKRKVKKYNDYKRDYNVSPEQVGRSKRNR
ncbi:hypothetical protein [Tenacibaculum sp. IB213877]|uniref:hypothetical protein n=1 Tax=Tenacibaculum sp. IB213877 TaxID=3097351 RepID=UPI002A59CB8B|nr:hypothetical protein [Tenacibaculum sp. IB213877]MDY0779819.1 hypothetical protein [Tenacibaculum sp. IB213877]